MNALDFIIILLALLAVGRGIQLGFFRQSLSLIGFFGGLFLGSALAPGIVRLIGGSQGLQLLSILLMTFGLAILFAGLGEFYGRKIQIKITKKPILIAETALGVIFSVVSTIVLTWLMASVLLRLPTANVAAHISESKIMQILDHTLPPAPGIMARLGQLVSPEGFPRVFTGIEPFSPDAGAPNEPSVRAAAEAAAASTVRIESLGCGGAVYGSGFVIDEGLIATNAHVIAGIRNPIVADQAGRHRAATVWFDPSLDFALLSIDRHAGLPLKLAENAVERGTTAAVLGFPGGGNFTASSAVTLSRHTAVGRNIYDTSLSRRDVYELQTHIEQGNSGGPVVLPDGKVIGMVFGKSAARESRAYAITSMEILSAMQGVNESESEVSTGRCVRS